ncbi:hypothetical protein PsYK624_003880 [Phanerochaete sordida]|uniref:DUF659 domain-containing protein n=1 Tax=Phanerochaete sordida TaxID=48140 RepID=A0A9P3L846_9APHY|nr:hypothetical protein PsYK624_003880 [Phanerochaete sordida]
MGLSSESVITGTPAHTLQPWAPPIQHQFGRDLCKVFVALNIPWHGVGNPEFWRFCRTWIPEARVPDRRALSGRFLDENVAEAESRVLEQVRGRLAMGQSDGWKNIAKTNVTTSVITVNHKTHILRTHNMTGRPKTGDEMLSLIRSDIQDAQKRLKVVIIGWTTDDGPDGKKARRILAAEEPQLIVTVCWAHQINLVVGDLFSLPEIAEVIAAAVEIVKWFNAHGAALDLHREAQKIHDPLHDPLALLLPVITRWTAHFQSVSRLLRLSIPTRSCSVTRRDKLLTSAGRTAEAKGKAQEVLRIVDDPDFWVRLTRVKTYLEPLAIAANVTQASHTRLDHVLITLGKLFHAFSDPKIDPAVSAKVHGSMERRWSRADQDLYILAVFFNPYIRSSCFATEYLPSATLIDIAHRAFKRFFGCEPDAGFRSALVDYIRRRAEFTDQGMGLEGARAEAECNGDDIDVVSIWELMDKSNDATQVSRGRNGVVRLAVRILSAIVNAGGCERTFSAFGVIHTKLRNHLAPDKVHKTAVVGQDLHEQHIEEGLIPAHRPKRKFGSDYPSATPSLDLSLPSREAPAIDVPPADAEDIDVECDFLQLARQLRSEAEAVEADDASPEGADPSAPVEDDNLAAQPAASDTPSETPRQSQRSRASRTSIPLAQLFAYPNASSSDSQNSAQSALNFFWAGGIKNLEDELAAYEILCPASHESQ